MRLNFDIFYFHLIKINYNFRFIIYKIIKCKNAPESLLSHYYF